MSYEQINRLTAEYQSAAAHLQPNATLYSLSFAHGGRDESGERVASLTSPFRHAVSISASRLYEESRWSTIQGYASQTGTPIDHVLMWELDDQVRESRNQAK